MMKNEVKPGTIVDFWCPRTGSRRTALVAKVGRVNASVVPLTAGKVVARSIPVDAIVRDLGYSRSRVRSWSTRIRSQGKRWGITGGASRALRTINAAVAGKGGR